MTFTHFILRPHRVKVLGVIDTDELDPQMLDRARDLYTFLQAKKDRADTTGPQSAARSLLDWAIQIEHGFAAAEPHLVPGYAPLGVVLGAPGLTSADPVYENPSRSFWVTAHGIWFQTHRILTDDKAERYTDPSALLGLIGVRKAKKDGKSFKVRQDDALAVARRILAARPALVTVHVHRLDDSQIRETAMHFAVHFAAAMLLSNGQDLDSPFA